METLIHPIGQARYLLFNFFTSGDARDKLRLKRVVENIGAVYQLHSFIE